MSVFAAISRRLQTLTTDAKPDPPRITIENSDLSPPIIKQKSAPVTPEVSKIGAVIPAIQRRRSASNEPTTQSEFPNTENFSFTGNSKPEPRPKSPRTKTKPKYKSSTNPVINYNIVNSNGVKIGSKTKYICNINQYPGNGNANPKDFSEKSKTEPMPPDVQELSSSKSVISLNDMLLIKTHIGYGWRDLARRLDYSEGQIQQFEENHKNKGVDQVIYQILLDWKQTKTKDAQLGVLVDIIWLCQEYDCAKRLAASHKKSNSTD